MTLFALQNNQAEVIRRFIVKGQKSKANSGILVFDNMAIIRKKVMTGGEI